MTRTIDLDSLELLAGGHTENAALQMCVMEAVAYVAGEAWSDHPQCACPTISTFLRAWNDGLDSDTRQKLKPYIMRLVGTNDGKSMRRSWMAMDWLTRECGPAFMDLTPALHPHAAAVRALPEIVDRASLDSALETINAAWAAAWDAAMDAAWDAAGAAAMDAAGAAATKTLAPVVNNLQASAFELLERMLAA